MLKQYPVNLLCDVFIYLTVLIQIYAQLRKQGQTVPEAAGVRGDLPVMTPNQQSYMLPPVPYTFLFLFILKI